MKNTPILDADKLAQELSDRGMSWADANAAAEALEETRQTVYSQIAAEYIGGGDSAAKSELLAKADDRYRKHLDAMVKARQAANKARVKYDTWRVYCEMQRSNAATQRSLIALT